jgi:hypothetical protein
MLTDFIAANTEDAQAILSTPGHANIWPTLEAKRIDPVKLASLAFILKGRPLEGAPVTNYLKLFESLAGDGDEGPWMQLLPTDLVDDLSTLSEDKVDPVARAWASTDAARLEGWRADDASSFLRELSAFAASAHAQGKKILLWTCP